MFNLGNVNELHKDLKGVLIWCLLMPFWYIALYLFHPLFFANNSVLTLAVFSFGLTTSGSYTMHNSWRLIFRFRRQTEIIEKLDPTNFYVTTLIFQTILLSALIFVAYFIRYFYNIKFDFFYFLLIFFSINILFYIACWITAKIEN